MQEIIDIVKDMASTGQPPLEGCSLFDVGYGKSIERLKKEYIESQFRQGKSGEKFLVGPYGAGKTHFIRQFNEIASSAGCATAEIQLSKAIDITKQLLVYKEIVASLRVPNQKLFGMKGILNGCIDYVREKSPDQEAQNVFLDYWVKGLEDLNFADLRYKRVMIRTVKALIEGNESVGEDGIRWLEGEVTNKNICRTLNETTVTVNEQTLFGHKAIFALCQFIKYCGFSGTIIAYDEAEQTTDVGKKKRDSILSMLRTESDARRQLNNLGASSLFFYAFTPDVIQEMYKYPALQQRMSEPDPKYKFFDGNIHSPIIDLQQPYDNKGASLVFLQKIGERLVNLFFDSYSPNLPIGRDNLLSECYEWAEEIDGQDQSIEKRRSMVKLVCSRLVDFYETHLASVPSQVATAAQMTEDGV